MGFLTLTDDGKVSFEVANSVQSGGVGGDKAVRYAPGLVPPPRMLFGFEDGKTVEEEEERLAVL